MSAEGYLLGLDVGTSGVKALLLPASGPVERSISATIDIPISTPRPGWTEQDPGEWWQAAVRAIRAVLERSGVDPEAIAAVATSGQMHGATLIDRTGEVVRPCILWNDQRTAAECEEITERIGAAQVLEWVGNPALTGFTAPKLLWLRNQEPDSFGRIATVLLPKDYVNFRLSGELATEVSDASGTLLFDVARREWSESMTQALEIPRAWLPIVYESAEPIGSVTSEAAQDTGLRPGMPVVAGGADNACAAVGAGVVSPGDILASLGTSGTLVAPSDEARIDAFGRLHTFCHAVPGTWYLMGVVLSAGGSLRWFRDVIGEVEARSARESDRDPYDLIMEEASAIPPGSEGLIFLPYLTGERTPHADPHARGVFFGLSLRHGRPHLARSVVEGVTYALADSAGLMRDLGLTVDTVRATGGGARSALWRGVLADVLNAGVSTSPGDTGPALGAALLAGVGAGVYPSVADAAQRLVRVQESARPNRKNVEAYVGYQALFRSLYPSLRQHFMELSALV